MNITTPLNVFRHILKGLCENPRFIEMPFNFQISGMLKTEDDEDSPGSYNIINESASFMLNEAEPYVLYNGTRFDTTSWFDCDISYFADLIDAQMSITIVCVYD